MLVSFWILAALAGPLIAPYAPGAFVSEEVFAGASSRFWLGSDFLGRDVLSRLLVGARFTVGLSAVAVTLASVTGTGLALTAAVGPRWLDELLSRAMDTLISIPSKIFALVLVAAFGFLPAAADADRVHHICARKLSHRPLPRGRVDPARLCRGGARAG